MFYTWLDAKLPGLSEKNISQHENALQTLGRGSWQAKP